MMINDDFEEISIEELRHSHFMYLILKMLL